MPREIQGRRFYSIAEVADCAGVTRQTLWRWRGAGHVPTGQRFRTGQVLFTESDIAAVRAYANQLEPASLDGIDVARRDSETKANPGRPVPLQETM